MLGRIRIEVDGKQIVSMWYSTAGYREKLINEALLKHEKIEVIISPDEQPQKRPGVADCRRGVSDIRNRSNDMGLRRTA